MDPEGVPAEVVALKKENHRLHEEPEGPAVNRYITVDITTEPPKDHFIWSLFCFIHSNLCCLGLLALIFSVKARDRKVVGDLVGAQRYSKRALSVNITATVLFCIMITVVVVLSFLQPTATLGWYRTYYQMRP